MPAPTPAKATLIMPSTTVPPGIAPSSTLKPAYPATRRGGDKDLLHGKSVADPYRWLEQAQLAETQAWMTAQDAVARRELSALPERAGLVKRLEALLYNDSIGIPVRRGDRVFFGQRHHDKEKAIVYWRPASGGEQRVLFDPNGWSAEGNVGLGSYSVSWDGRTVAYQLKLNNSDEAILKLMDVESGKVSEVDTIPGAKYAHASWMPDGQGFYYTRLPVDPKIPAAERPGHAEIRFHRLGQDPAGDALVRERTGDARTFQNVEVSRDGRTLLLSVQHGWASSDLWVRDLTDPAGSFRPLVVGRPNLYQASVWGGRIYLKTSDGAPLGRILVVDPRRPEPAAWKELVPERRDQPLEGISIVGGRIAAVYLRDATQRIELFELDGKPVREQALPGLGSTSGMIGLEDDDLAYFSFESFLVPPEIHQVNVRTGETKLFFKLQAPIDPAQFSLEQRFATSRDGARVPFFVVARKDLKRDGQSPTLLYGYGGFQVAMTPAFRAGVYAFLERGGVWVSAVLRGGSEYGEPWHQAGMLLQKQNVFDDFFAVAEELGKQRIASPAHLAAYGGSNGGLLVGAAITQRPDLFRAAVCAVPLLDMVRYHQFGSGATWVGEYGSAADPEQFQALYGYSPYHHISNGVAYPATLLLSADSDDRVDPLHARKMAAALQAASTGGPVLLRIERNAGHGGADQVKASVEQLADVYAFALTQLR